MLVGVQVVSEDDWPTHEMVDRTTETTILVSVVIAAVSGIVLGKEQSVLVFPTNSFNDGITRH
jgi:cytochrome b subunit of formate dehydrogenase